MLRIALLQISSGRNLSENREIGIRMCKKAKELSADIVLFPEMWSNGYDILTRSYDEWKTDAISSDSAFIETFRNLARELEMAIAITFLEKSEGHPRNSLLLFDKTGCEKLHYSKVHTCDFSAERNLEPGDDFYTADVDTDDGTTRIGAMICYDREFPESSRILMLKGAEVILVPNACPMDVNRLSQLRSRAFENMVAIATCNYPKTVPDCNGHSSVFDGIAYQSSHDMRILEAGDDEGIYIADIDMDMLRKYRRNEVHGNAYRHPEKYHLLIGTAVNEPFIRKDRRQ